MREVTIPPSVTWCFAWPLAGGGGGTNVVGGTAVEVSAAGASGPMGAPPLPASFVEDDVAAGPGAPTTVELPLVPEVFVGWAVIVMVTGAGT